MDRMGVRELRQNASRHLTRRSRPPATPVGQRLPCPHCAARRLGWAGVVSAPVGASGEQHSPICSIGLRKPSGLRADLCTEFAERSPRARPVRSGTGRCAP